MYGLCMYFVTSAVSTIDCKVATQLLSIHDYFCVCVLNAHCVVHFMYSGTLKCLIQHSSELYIYYNVLFMNCYV